MTDHFNCTNPLRVSAATTTAIAYPSPSSPLLCSHREIHALCVLMPTIKRPDIFNSCSCSCIPKTKNWAFRQAPKPRTYWQTGAKKSALSAALIFTVLKEPLEVSKFCNPTKTMVRTPSNSTQSVNKVVAQTLFPPGTLTLIFRINERDWKRERERNKASA